MARKISKKEKLQKEVQAKLERIRRERGLPEKGNTQPTSPSVSNIVEAHFKHLMKRCRAHDTDIPCLICAAEEAAEAERKERQRALAEEERRKNPGSYLQHMGVGKRYLGCSLDTFVGGKDVVELCRTCAKQPFDLVLGGVTGCGKTHLGTGILCERAIAGHVDDRMVTVPELLLEIRHTFSGSASADEQALIRQYTNVPLLVLDDLGAEKTTEWAITTLALIVDRRHRDSMPTVVTTNLRLREIQDHLSPRIASRLAAGRVVWMDLPDWRRKR